MIFPPHATKQYLTCPLKWSLAKKWVPRGEWTPYRLLGTALSKGVEVYWTKASVPDTSIPTEDAWQAAKAALAEGFVEQDKWTLEGLTKLLAKGMAASLGDSPGHVSWSQVESLVATEPQDMVGRPDLITRRLNDKALIVTEQKLSYSLKSQWVGKRLMEYETDWQIWHYAWEVGEFYGEEVKEVRVQLVSLTPSAKSFLYTVKITPGRLKAWHTAAQMAWNGMAYWLDQADPSDTFPSPPANWTSCNDFGGCEYKVLCHTLEGDESKAESFYESLTSQESGPQHDDY